MILLATGCRFPHRSPAECNEIVRAMTANAFGRTLSPPGGRVELLRRRHLRNRAFVYVATTGPAIAWTLVLGKDVHWDAINYQLYLGSSALNDRFALDLR